jgi:hypothetical protein
MTILLFEVDAGGNRYGQFALRTLHLQLIADVDFDPFRQGNGLLAYS